jgi:hypothetical protein
MAIVGARSAMRKGSFVISPATIRVRIGEPIPTKGITLDARNEVTQTLRERIVALLRQLG